MKYRITSLYFLLVVFTLSCNRDDTIVTNVTNIDPIPIQYFDKSSIIGQVSDEDSVPISDVKVKYLNVENKIEETFTDENGDFEFTNKAFNENGQIITFEKGNYFKQFAFVQPKLNKSSYINILQHKKTNGQTINPKIAGNYGFYNNTINCLIPENNFLDNTGEYCKDNIKLYFKSLFQQFAPFCYPELGMPQSNIGIDFDGNERMVFPVFSFLLQAEDNNKNALSLKESISIQISPNLISCSNDDDLILWHFNENTGKWNAESIIDFNTIDTYVLINPGKTGYYILSRAKSFIVKLSGQIYYPDEITPAKNLLIEVYDENLGLIDITITNNFGVFTIYKEDNSKIELKIFGCSGNPLYISIIQDGESTIEDIILPPSFITEYNIEIHRGSSTSIVEISDILSQDFYPFPRDTFPLILNFQGCSPYLISYNLDNLPIVKSTTPIYLSENQTIYQSDLAYNYESNNYLYANIENKEKEIFSTAISLSPEFDFNTVGFYSFSNNAAIRYKEGDDKCHFLYIEFSDENNYTVYESIEIEPLDIDFKQDDNTITAHFQGSIIVDSQTEHIDGYFKVNKNF